MRLEYFQMIDRVRSIDPDALSITCESRVPDASPVFEGHFPGHPIMPGVLMTETMAQASGILVMALDGHRQMAFLVGVDKARFRSFVGPGSDLTITARRLHEGSGYAVTEARIESDGKRICDAEIKLRMMPFPNDLVANALRAQAERLGIDLGAMAR